MTYDVRRQHHAGGNAGQLRCHCFSSVASNIFSGTARIRLMSRNAVKSRGMTVALIGDRTNVSLHVVAHRYDV